MRIHSLYAHALLLLSNLAVAAPVDASEGTTGLLQSDVAAAPSVGATARGQAIIAPPLLLPLYNASTTWSGASKTSAFAKRDTYGTTVTQFINPTDVPVVDYIQITLVIVNIQVYIQNEVIVPLTLTQGPVVYVTQTTYTTMTPTTMQTVLTVDAQGNIQTPDVTFTSTLLPPQAQDTSVALPPGYYYDFLVIPGGDLIIAGITVTYSTTTVVIIIGDLPVFSTTMVPTQIITVSNGIRITISTSINVPTMVNPAPSNPSINPGNSSPGDPPAASTSSAQSGSGQTSSAAGTLTQSTASIPPLATSTSGAQNTASPTTSNLASSPSSAPGSTYSGPDGTEIDLSSLSFPFVDQPAWRQAMVEQHNSYRARHNAPEVTWDSALSAAALARVNSHVFSHNPPSGYGENIASGGYSNPLFYVFKWYDEIRQYNYAAGQYSDAVGHATQLLWKSSIRIGCAVISNNPTNGYPYYLACEYSPNGNYIGEFTQNVLPPNSNPYPTEPRGFL